MSNGHKDNHGTDIVYSLNNSFHWFSAKMLEFNVLTLISMPRPNLWHYIIQENMDKIMGK